MSSMYGATGQGAGNKIPKGYQSGRLQNFTPEQMQLFQSLFSNLGPESFLSQLAGGNPETFADIERPALQQFSGQLGNLASRFSGMGLGARKSSGFQNQATSAASQFSQQLQSQRQGLQRQALQDLFGMSNQLLSQRPYDQFVYKKPDFLSQLFGYTGQAVDMAAKIAPFFI